MEYINWTAFFQLVFDTWVLGLLKMIYNTQRSWNKQSQSVNVRPKQNVNTLNTQDP